MLAAFRGERIAGFYAPQAKGHGTKQSIEGNATEGPDNGSCS